MAKKLGGNAIPKSNGGGEGVGKSPLFSSDSAKSKAGSSQAANTKDISRGASSENNSFANVAGGKDSGSSSSFSSSSNGSGSDAIDPVNKAIGKSTSSDDGTDLAGKSSGSANGSGINANSSSNNADNGLSSMANKVGKDSGNGTDDVSQGGDAASSASDVASSSNSVDTEAFSSGSGLYSMAGSKSGGFFGKNVDDSLDDGDGSSDSSGKDIGQQVGKQVGKQAARTAAAGSVPAAGVIGTAALLNTLKSMLYTGIAAAANLASSIGAMLLGAGKAVLSWFGNIGTAISSAVGGFISATAAAVVSGAVVVASVVGGAIGIGVLTADPGFDDGKKSCVEAVEQAKSDNTTAAVGDASAETLKNAETIYGVFSSWGMSDENIAGMLGNFDVESGIDPTGVETIYDEPHQIGPRKSKAESQGFAVSALAPEYGARFPLIKNVGLGLGQWTDTNDGANGNTNLRKFADSNNAKWYDLNTQLSFMMSDRDSHNGALKQYMADPKGTPEEAAIDFSKNWEGNTVMAQAERQERAKEWFMRLGNWDKDDALANSLLAQAGTTVEAANEKSIHNAMNNCVKTKNLDFDNSTIASAMVSYSWPYRSQSIANKGTDLYVEVHDKVLKGDPYYASCDRSVATAVRWGGGDDNFPAGAVPTQKTYMDTNSEKWAKVPWGGDVSKLKPGDIGISPGEGHVVMFVGEELPKAKYPDGNYEANADLAEGSLDAAGSQTPNENTRSPHLSNVNGRTDYTYYRNIKPETNSIYKDVVSGMSGSFGNVSKDAAGAIKAAESQLGVPYVWGGESPGVGLDCSGLTQFAWKQAGVQIPHDSRQQYKQGKQVPYKDRQAGDLIFWARNTSDPSTIYHVAILTSPDQIIHAPVPGDVVKRGPISSGGSTSALMPMVVRLGL